MDADKILHQAELLYRSLHAGDHEVALRHARDLKAGADSICLQLTPLVFNPTAKAKADLSRILAAKGKPTIWKVELRPPATDTDEETTRRVRAFLKSAFRSFQLTAVTAIKVTDSVVEKLPPQSEVANG